MAPVIQEAGSITRAAQPEGTRTNRKGNRPASFSDCHSGAQLSGYLNQFESATLPLTQSLQVRHKRRLRFT
jgi:hypothetical protein